MGDLRNGRDMDIAAVEAISQVLAKGSASEHHCLVQARPDVLTVALNLHDQPSKRQHSLKLLNNLVTHLSYLLLRNEEQARELFSLFEWVIRARFA